MTETFEEAVARLTKEYHPQGGTPSQKERGWIEDDARYVLKLAALPVLVPDAYGNYRCTATTARGTPCSRFLEHNYTPKDADGYASLNCIHHGWVGKWRREPAPPLPTPKPSDDPFGTKAKLEWDRTHNGGKGGCHKRCRQCGAFCDVKHRVVLAAFHIHSGMPRTSDGRLYHTTDWGPA